ncbi:MAG TPA: 3-phosphoserine/phosphohydroxythreonine transaminase [Phycisphaerales bacterium]|nr:3-phosphoserine/phosphohydroxythreonine transaminase [Phycisphaerales bacterium]
MPDRIFNFSAGPGVMPEPVLKQAQHDLWNLFDTGIGICEHSHRGKAFDRVLAEAEQDCRDLAGIPKNYHILFVQGGASLQFAMLPMNFLHEGKTADYLNTGEWARRAVKEAQRFGKVNEAASSEAKNYTYIPAENERKYTRGGDAAYCHFTSNNTIFGTQFTEEPRIPSGVPLVCDASSDIFSKPIDVTKYAFIYAGAQKNLGPSGIVLLIVRDDFLQTAREDLTPMLSYKVHAKDGSRHNTPNTFGIYLVGQTFKWLKSFGGLRAMSEHNARKAKILYDHLDSTDFFRGTVEPKDRSQMNVTFRCRNEALEDTFVKEATAAGFDGLKGHRSVGGMRASMYNAFPIDGVRQFVEFMKNFERTHR